MSTLDRLIAYHAAAMQRFYAIGGVAAARWHCAQFTEYRRRQAQTLFNDGTGAPGQRNSSHAGAPSPLSSEECADGAREEK